MLVKTSLEILDQLECLLKQLNAEQYANHLPVLSKNSVGKHVRHLIEFWQCQLQGMTEGIIDYDARERNVLLETDLSFVSRQLKQLKSAIGTLVADRELYLQISYGSNDSVRVSTTLFRELAYNIEHTIHHLAIIRIAVGQSFPEVILPPHLGLAYSTAKFQQTLSGQ
jgi:uncharacterized damage-inducible protein DinB